MFETEGFKEQLEKAISTEAGRNNMEQYETRIIEYLQGLASGNERTLMEREVRKSPSERRGTVHALQSATELTREAALYATAEGRKVLRLPDFERAYEAKFCQVWPFCKS